MNILFLAPHPFYQDRGTPIAVDMMLRVLSDRKHRVDLVTFPEGEDRDYSGLRISRVKPLGKVVNVGPGFSLKKIYLDVFLLFSAWKHLRRGDYDLIHAVEESAFIAWFLGKFYRVPYVYDMDSQMSQQLLARAPALKAIAAPLRWFEALVTRRAAAVAPMCQDLADMAERDGARSVTVIKDVSLIRDDPAAVSVEDIRAAHEISGPIVMYIGNLEPYQGIDLLLESFKQVVSAQPDTVLAIIGGSKPHIEHYADRAKELGLGGSVLLLGPRPVERIGAYLRQADILVSPRSEGSNTPMKIYSYLHSGVAVVATRLPTHTQVLNDGNAMLADAAAEDFAAAIVSLLRDAPGRKALGERARQYAETEHGFDGFTRSVDRLYGGLAGGNA